MFLEQFVLLQLVKETVNGGADLVLVEGDEVGDAEVDLQVEVDDGDIDDEDGRVHVVFLLVALAVVLVEAEYLLLFLAVEVGEGVDYHLQVADVVPVPVLDGVLDHDEVSFELTGGEVVYNLCVLLLNHIRLRYLGALFSVGLRPLLQQLQML